jgi:selenide, water dikinase
MGPGDLDQALCDLHVPENPNVLAGMGGSEDAGVFRLNDETALIQTVDFFTPIVDDPRIFGRAAAANSLSDVYAMGGRPITAMNVVCFPIKKLGIEYLQSILAGGLDIMREAGVALVGGHSVEDDEPKYGLSVSGIVHPDRIMTNSALRPGDSLVLTKPVGTGAIAAAFKGNLASDASMDAMVRTMCTLNKTSSEVASRYGVRAATDVTGFGLAGHLVEMAKACSCLVRLRSDAVPVLEGAAESVSMGMVPKGAHSNRDYFGRWTKVDPNLPLEVSDLMFDPQTSGGLILGIPAEKAGDLVKSLCDEGVGSASEIGEVLDVQTEGRLEII